MICDGDVCYCYRLLGKFVPTYKEEMTTISLDDDIVDGDGRRPNNSRTTTTTMDAEYKTGCACVVM